jgi:hypothetical protein
MINSVSNPILIDDLEIKTDQNEKEEKQKPMVKKDVALERDALGVVGNVTGNQEYEWDCHNARNVLRPRTTSKYVESMRLT